MALPTVSHQVLNTGSPANLAGNMVAFQQMLFDKGWTIAYADADAIGTGSAASPAWDKTPAGGTAAGVAIYVMPANGFTRQWYVEITPTWGSTVSAQWQPLTRIGTGQSGGVLATPGGIIDPTRNNTIYESDWVIASVSEDGFLMVHSDLEANLMRGYAEADNQLLLVERARDFDGTVLEDLIVMNPFMLVSAFYLECAVYNAIDGSELGLVPQGEATTSAYCAFEFAVRNGTAGGYATTVTAATTTGQPDRIYYTIDPANEFSTVMGPFPRVNRLYAPPRLMVHVFSNQIISGVDTPIFVDGGIKSYATYGDGDNNIYAVYAKS